MIAIFDPEAKTMELNSQLSQNLGEDKDLEKYCRQWRAEYTRARYDRAKSKGMIHHDACIYAKLVPVILRNKRMDHSTSQMVDEVRIFDLGCTFLQPIEQKGPYRDHPGANGYARALLSSPAQWRVCSDEEYKESLQRDVESVEQSIKNDLKRTQGALHTQAVHVAAAVKSILDMSQSSPSEDETKIQSEPETTVKRPLKKV